MADSLKVETRILTTGTVAPAIKRLRNRQLGASLDMKEVDQHLRWDEESRAIDSEQLSLFPKDEYAR